MYTELESKLHGKDVEIHILQSKLIAALTTVPK